MQRIITVAAILLAVQIGLIIAFHRPSEQHAAFVPEAPFLAFDPLQVTGIELTNGDGEQLLLSKREDRWVIPAAANARADSGQIDDLLTRLAGERKGFAVATSAGAAPRFKVAADTFDHRLVLKSGDADVAGFYLGTAAGLRRSHARVTGENDIVIVGIGGYEVDARRDNWLDKNALQCDREAIRSIIFPDFTVIKDAAGWQFADAAAGESPVAETVDELLGSVCGLSIQTVLDAELADRLFAGEPILEYQVENQDGNRTRYQFTALEDDEHAFALQVSGHDASYKVYGWLVNDLQSFNREKLSSLPAGQSRDDTGVDATDENEPGPSSQ